MLSRDWTLHAHLDIFGTLGVSTHQTLPVTYMLYTYGGNIYMLYTYGGEILGRVSFSVVTAGAPPA